MNNPPNRLSKNVHSSEEIEEAILGLSIQDNDVAIKMVAYLDIDDFYFPKNRIIFQSIEFLIEQNQTIESANLINYLKEKKLFSKVDNGEYIQHLIQSSGYKVNLSKYFEVLLSKTGLRKIEVASKEILTKLDSNVANYESLVEEFQTSLYDIEQKKQTKEFVESKHLIKKIVEDISKRQDDKTITGLITGFNSIDAMTSGLQKGDLIIIAARPSMGKTAFALNVANTISKSHNVAFFSLEMPAEQLLTRIISIEGNIDGNKLKNPTKMDDVDWKRLYLVQDKIEKINLFIDDSPTIKLSEIVWKSRRLKNKGKLDLIIIDYLQLIPLSHKISSDNRQQEVSTISRTLKQLARELEIPIIALSQLSRKVEQREDKTPMMSDLRESGAIEQDADIIGFLYREDYYNKDKEQDQDFTLQQTEFIVSKHRNGSVGTITLGFNLAKGKFTDQSKK
ncbi:MAG: replicative DNA helicase [Mycoplasmataceae bacterium]|nr:replicative DNA helicase [Mycoplasmataceae bacterium]